MGIHCAEGHALVIGVGGELPHTVDDAGRLAGLLQRSGFQVRLLAGAQATREEILAALDELARSVSRESVVLIYFSGYCGRIPSLAENRALLLPYGYDRERFSETMIDEVELATRLQSLAARAMLLLFDCGHEGEPALGGVQWFRVSSPPEMQTMLEQGRNRAVIAATREGEHSMPGRPYGALVQALARVFSSEGIARRDGTVWVSDLGRYLWDAVPRLSQGRQHPEIYQEAAEDFVLGCFVEEPLAPQGVEPLDPVALPEFTGSGWLGVLQRQLTSMRMGMQRSGAENTVAMAATAEIEAVQAQTVEANPDPAAILARLRSLVSLLDPSVVAGEDVAQVKTLAEETLKTLVPLETLALDVAVPEQVYQERSFEVAVMIRQSGSPALQEADLPAVSSGEVQLLWSTERPYVNLRVQVSAPDCEVHGNAAYTFQLYAGRDSSRYYFMLTPKVLGEIGIVVEVYQEERCLGSARVHTSVAAQLAGAVKTAVFSVSLTTGDLRPALVALDDVELDALCMDHFPEVYDRFAQGMRRDQKINLLLDHCRRQGEMERLAQLLGRSGDGRG